MPSKSLLISKVKRSMKNSCKETLFHLDESFVSHDTKRWNLLKRLKSNLFDRGLKDESFKKKEF